MKWSNPLFDETPLRIGAEIQQGGAACNHAVGSNSQALRVGHRAERSAGIPPTIALSKPSKRCEWRRLTTLHERPTEAGNLEELPFEHHLEAAVPPGIIGGDRSRPDGPHPEVNLARHRLREMADVGSRHHHRSAHTLPKHPGMAPCHAVKETLDLLPGARRAQLLSEGSTVEAHLKLKAGRIEILESIFIQECSIAEQPENASAATKSLLEQPDSTPDEVQLEQRLSTGEAHPGPLARRRIKQVEAPLEDVDRHPPIGPMILWTVRTRKRARGCQHEFDPVDRRRGP
jgi:hypothetical protein